MTRKVNRNVSLPRCRHCHRFWRPAEGVVASKAYCKKCSKERRVAATSALGLRPFSSVDITGPYLLPRHLRPS